MTNFETARQLFVEGLQQLEANDLQAAERSFTRSLAIVPDRVSTLNNLSAVKIRQEKFVEAEELARKAAGLDKSAEAWANLGVTLTATNRLEEALAAHERALECNPLYARAWLNKAMTLLKLKRHDEALPACDQSLRLNPSQHEALYTKSLILKELARAGEARKVYLSSLEMRSVSSPVAVTERRAGQKGEVLVVSSTPYIDDSFQSFDNLHFDCPNFPGQLASVFQDEFHFTFVFDGMATRPSARRQIPQPDAVINNCANAVLVHAGGRMADLVDMIDSFNVPVVNHPNKVLHTTRDAEARLLENVPGLFLPKTRRFSSTGKTPQALAHEIEDHFHYPLITRTLGAQAGYGMTKVDSPEALATVLGAGLEEEFLVTQFVDSRGGNPFFRKLRAAVVKDDIIIVRVDYDTHWNVHGRKAEKRVPFYLANLYLLDEEKRICKDPEAALGQSAMRALREVRNRIPLDVFGIDFEVDANGLLVFYEANATMNLLPTAQKQVPNPIEPNERLKETFRQYLSSLVSRSQSV